MVNNLEKVGQKEQTKFCGSRKHILSISHLKTDFNLSSYLDQCSSTSSSCHSCRPTEAEHSFSLSVVTAFINISARF